MVTFSLTFTDLNPVFQVTAVLKSNISKTVRDFGDLDWPLNASRGLSAVAKFLDSYRRPMSHRPHNDAPAAHAVCTSTLTFTDNPHANDRKHCPRTSWLRLVENRLEIYPSMSAKLEAWISRYRNRYIAGQASGEWLIDRAEVIGPEVSRTEASLSHSAQGTCLTPRVAVIYDMIGDMCTSPYSVYFTGLMNRLINRSFW